MVTLTDQAEQWRARRGGGAAGEEPKRTGTASLFSATQRTDGSALGVGW